MVIFTSLFIMANEFNFSCLEVDLNYDFICVSMEKKHSIVQVIM